MKTIQVTLLEELHARCKSLASARRTPLKEFFVAAIEAHVHRIEARMPKSTPKKRGSR